MIRFTKHGQEAVETRNIAFEWIEATVTSPDSTDRDPRYPERTRSYRAIAAFGGRVLRVVHRPDGDDILIITVHFDLGGTP
ncbi:MAG TPA: DUF4258 domain-containing protein [Stellaceae bacterium]